MPVELALKLGFLRNLIAVQYLSSTIGDIVDAVTNLAVVLVVC